MTHGKKNTCSTADKASQNIRNTQINKISK